MADDRVSTSKPVLPYATPPRRRGQPVAGGLTALLGLCVALGGAAFLLGAIIDLIHSRPSTGIHTDREELVDLGIIGLFCLIVGLITFRIGLAKIAGRGG